MRGSSRRQPGASKGASLKRPPPHHRDGVMLGDLSRGPLRQDRVGGRTRPVINVMWGVEMSELRWRRRLGQMFLLMTGGMIGAMVVIFIPMFIMSGAGPFMLLPLALLIAGILPGFIIVKSKWKDVLDSISTFVSQPAHIVIPRLEGVLTEEEIQFTKKGSKEDGRPSRRIKWDAVFELSHSEMTLHILASQRRTGIFLGPVRKDNGAQVDRLKDVVARITS